MAVMPQKKTTSPGASGARALTAAQIPQSALC